jgi:hypothetical protein
MLPARLRRLIAYPTYQGRKPDDEFAEPDDNRLIKLGRKGTCPCKGPPSYGDHDFNKCPYINLLVRLKGWSPD